MVSSSFSVNSPNATRGRRSRPVPLRTTALALSLVLLAGCGGTPLYSNLQEQQANEITAALLEANIHATKQIADPKAGSWSVEVARSDFPMAMQVADSRGLPRQHHPSFCEVFKKEGFASSATEERGRYLCSLQEELARTVSRIPGVVDARVHIALPERDPLGNEGKPSSVSVAIYQQPGINLSDRDVGLKLMLKDGIEGLDDVNKVTIQYFTMPAPSRSVGNTGFMPASLASLDPLLIAIVVAVLGFLAVLAFLLKGRSKPAAKAAEHTLESYSSPANPQRPGGVWNG